ncbi:MAG: HEAT repeat domain-containing protein [Gemmatales bacterium]
MRMALRWLVFVLPSILLLLQVLLSPVESQFWLLIGFGISAGCGLLALSFFRELPSIRFSCLFLSVLALPWLFISMDLGSYFTRTLSEVILLVMAVSGLCSYWLDRSGAWVYRRARLLSETLARKTDWPKELIRSKDISEAKAFREAIRYDAGPALNLLEHTHPGVRIAALSALEFRTNWTVGQTNEVMRLIESDRVAEVRHMAVRALGNQKDRKTTEILANSLSDQDEAVRHAAAEMLFMKSDRRSRDRRWQWMRNGVRLALSSNFMTDQGPILREGQTLSSEAVADFIAWVGDRGQLGVRSAETLSVHYARLMREEPDETSRELISVVENAQTPAILRVQLAKLISNQYKGDIRLMEKLLHAGNPVPLRQMAAETLLTRTGRHPEALATLREIAKLGNRELALDTARIVQHCLNIDLGMAIGQPMPHPASPRAADITRKLLQWAMQSEPSQNAIDLGGRSGF